MSFIDATLTLTKQGNIQKITNPISSYVPNEKEKERLMMIRQNFTSGDVMMKRPRRELNDISLLERIAIDQMSFGVYQPNDGDSLEGDVVNGWRSNAVRPIVRNKIISIAAHVCARTIFPRIVSFDKNADEQKGAATVMEDLLEWSILNSNSSFADVSMNAVVAALASPVSYVYTEYSEVYRTVKREKTTQGWTTEEFLDEDNSGFKDESVPAEQVYFQDFYQPDIQKQGWLIRRRVRPFTLLKELYGHYENFQYVKPGVQIVYNDANQQFYEAYDLTMRTEEGEEVLYWNKGLDLYLCVVNGILLSDPDEPNPREDKLYPWCSFGYELLRPNGDCAVYKSLAFKTLPDEKIVNSLYPMIIDGSYLSVFQPMVQIGGETISSDVIVPGAVTTLSDPQAKLQSLYQNLQGIQIGLDMLQKVEENITESSIDATMQGELPPGSPTAYQISKLDQNASIMLGLFLKMVGKYVKQFSRLRIGDIKQYMTTPEVMAIEGSDNTDLVYKTFFMQEGKGRSKGRKIQFDLDMPEGEMSHQDHLAQSMDIANKEQASGFSHSLLKVNPRLFRMLNYMILVTPDILTPPSEEVERAFNLELYDRAIQNPDANQEAIYKDVLLASYPKTKKDPDKYVQGKGAQQSPFQLPQNTQNTGQNNQQQPNQQAQNAQPPTPTQTPVQTPQGTRPLLKR